VSAPVAWLITVYGEPSGRAAYCSVPLAFSCEDRAPRVTFASEVPDALSACRSVRVAAAERVADRDR
jgi:hypothetical protein